MCKGESVCTYSYFNQVSDKTHTVVGGVPVSQNGHSVKRDIWCVTGVSLRRYILYTLLCKKRRLDFFSFDTVGFCN